MTSSIFGNPSPGSNDESQSLEDGETTSTSSKSSEGRKPTSDPVATPIVNHPIPSSPSSSSDADPRPNRFSGPPSTWRTWTQDERGLHASLQRQRATDLGAHLYNAHWLRRRGRGTVVEEVRAWTPKEFWYRVEDGQEVAGFPPARWDAWPMRPEVVPRAEGGRESFGRLEEEVLAAGLRAARELWEARSSEGPDDVEKGESRAADTRGHGGKASRESTASRASASSGSVSNQRRKPDSAATSPAGSNLQLSPRGNDADTDDESFGTPVFSADEEESARVFRPIARSVISQLDSLLTALSVSRRNHYAYSRERAAGLFEPSERDMETASPERRKRTVPRPRDWSEVLGIAAISGWDRGTVHAAAIRCSSLFGESMSFASLEEGVRQQEPLELVNYIAGAVSAADEGNSDDADSETAQWSLDDLVCPHTECERYGEHFVGRHRLMQHIRQVHKWDPVTDSFPMALHQNEKTDFLDPIRRRSGWRGKNKTKAKNSNGAEVKQERKRRRVK